ncbi:MAG TPA: extensin family protein, partial [Candidatus Acidoferrum sp.]|nr:extensin family protein [Candidatus Acidoferrum sp.]
GRQCLRELRELGVRFKRAPRRRMIATPVVVPDMTFGPVVFKPTYRRPPFVMDCRLARAFAVHAGVLASVGIRELRFSSIYDFRRVRLHHRVHRALSRHALGLAVDVFEVVLATGARLVVRKDYWSSPALMVAELALRATGDFRAILSPAVDPESHGDHLHMEVKVEEPERARHRARSRRTGRVSRRPGAGGSPPAPRDAAAEE